MRHPRLAWLRPTLVLLVLATLQGCYLVHVTAGQARILWGRESIQERLDDPHPLDPSLRRKFELVLEVRRFAIDVLGLAENDSYTTYYDTGGDPVAWNVSAAPRDALVPLSWSFPFVGTVPYLGYFRREPAIQAARELNEQDLDVLVLPVPAYSTLGWFDDPVYTSLLRDDEARIAEVVIHELTHATFWVPGDVELNENLATFVGEIGARMFFRARGGEDDPALTLAANNRTDSTTFSQAMIELHEAIGRIYASSARRERKIALKDAEVERFRRRYREEVRPRLHEHGYDWVLNRRINLNNALILQFRRYHGDQEELDALHRLCGEDLRATLRALQEIADADDPRAELSARAARAPAPPSPPD